VILALVSPSARRDLEVVLGADPAPVLIAGGTDLLIAPARLPAAGIIVDLSRLAELSVIDEREGGLFVGAAVTVARLAREPLVHRLAPVLALAADDFGSVQIRNRATIGGNIANAAAAADLAPALVAAGAEAVLWTAAGGGGAEERLAVAALLARRPVPGRGRAIAGFLLPRVAAPRAAFVKLGRRQEPAIARLTLAATGPAGALALVAGAIGPAPQRLAAAEAALNAGGAGLLAALAAAVGEAIPGRASAAYKARAIRGLGADLLERLGTEALP